MASSRGPAGSGKRPEGRLGSPYGYAGAIPLSGGWGLFSGVCLQVSLKEARSRVSKRERRIREMHKP